MRLDLNLHAQKENLIIKKEEGKTLVFDPIRKAYIILLPEELVRQLLIQYFIHENIYSQNLIQVEKSIKVNDIERRFDIVVYDKTTKPFLLIECKSHTSRINQSVFDQASMYNIALKAPYLMVCNGVSTYLAHIDFENGSFQFQSSFPTLT